MTKLKVKIKQRIDPEGTSILLRGVSYMERISTDIIEGHGDAAMEENKKENVSCP